VLSDRSFLGPREINAMRVVPELVFVNCCHLAARDLAQLLAPEVPPGGGSFDRPMFAAGVADALIRVGVRCVIAAGWAVDDEPASAFARAFYDALLQGCRFIDAVAQAREEARRFPGNTWAAYQCYGDPDWRYRTGPADAQRPPSPVDEFAGVASAEALILALDTLAVRSEFQHAPADAQAQKIRYLEATFGEVWGDRGRAAEAFGNAWGKAGNRERAIAWYERARNATDGTASFVAMEQLANFYARAAWDRLARVAPSHGEGGRRQGGRAEQRKGKGARPTARAGQALRTAVADAVRQIDQAKTLLDRLLAIGPTVERLSVYGSLYKRLAMVHEIAGDARSARSALEQMRARYAEAQELARSSGSADLFYPGMNRLAAEMALTEAGGAPVPAQDLDLIRDSLARKAATTPDFWSVVGQTELKMYEALWAGGDRLAARVEEVVAEFTGHHDRVSAPRMWDSVYDNARFVLSRYGAQGGPGGRAARERILKTLAGFSSSAKPGRSS
jgi:tetratricopeptide (TPR) repeat protein